MSNEYKGWTLYNKVTLVIRKGINKKYEAPMAYVVDAKNDKQLKSAINWGTIKKEGNIVEPDIITVPNQGFVLKLLDSAHSSIEGGKLSFWNCLIVNNNLKFVVGINSDLLLQLLLSNTFIDGLCQKEILFARNSGHLGVLTTDMNEYKEALNDMTIKSNINRKKTSKWVIGKNYITLKINDLYLGNIYRPIELKYYYNYNNRTNRKLEFDYDNKKSIIKNLNREKLKNEITTYKELLNYWKDCIDNCFESNKSKTLYSILSDIKLKVDLFYCNYSYGKFPARQQGDVELIIDVEDVGLELYELIHYTQLRILEEVKLGRDLGNIDCLLDDFIIRPYRFEVEELNPTEKQLIKLYSDTIDKSELENKN